MRESKDKSQPCYGMLTPGSGLERAEDEKQIEKLYKDVQTGALRRKRGGGFDLSDSEDEVERRRRKKQREFAAMRAALLKDENVGKIGETLCDPKQVQLIANLDP